MEYRERLDVVGKSTVELKMVLPASQTSQTDDEHIVCALSKLSINLFSISICLVLRRPGRWRVLMSKAWSVETAANERCVNDVS